jgi:hypothetical protein
MDAGEAMNEAMTGLGHATLALQVVVATVEDASVAWREIDWRPGA